MNDDTNELINPVSLKQRGWELQWQDDFNGDALEAAAWSRCKRGTAEWQDTMTDDPELLKVEDSVLTLMGVVNNKNDNDTSPFLTAGVNSKQKINFKYGKIQIRARYKSAGGAWPALWMLGENKKWPACGEIDLMEHLNFDDIVYQTIHTTYTDVTDKTDSPQRAITVDVDKDDWNTYGCEWDKESVIFTVNGKPTLKYSRIPEKGEDQWPFTQPFYIIMSMQIGGGWVHETSPSNPEDYPACMQVDWVRIYKKSQ